MKRIAMLVGWIVMLLSLSSVATAKQVFTLPESLTTLEQEAFAGNWGITEIVVPDGVTTIGDAVFSGCSNLKTIYLPQSVSAIGQNAFNTGRSDTVVMVIEDSFAHQWCETNKVAYRVYDPDPVEVRALSIYEVTIQGASDIPTQARDSAMIERMLAKANPGGSSLVSNVSVTNASKITIKNKIAELASQADKNDVSFFFMFCHGDDSVTEGRYAGMMALSDGNWMSFGELADLLDDIPGKVMIVLLSCGSGSSIDRAANLRSADTTFDGDAFAREFIRVIAERDREIAHVDSPMGGYSIMPATGELKKEGKFYVITAARGGESGIYSVFTYLGEGFSHLIRWMYDGVVEASTLEALYNLEPIRKADLSKAMPADANKNNIVTLGEMETWLNTMSANNLFDMGKDGIYQMRPQVYPSGSDFELFIKY